eukprot:scaffold27617_cov19-Tisochrysis_lutea.AAC.1
MILVLDWMNIELAMRVGGTCAGWVEACPTVNPSSSSTEIGAWQEALPPVHRSSMFTSLSISS